jgi:hypothetical protein
MLGEHHLCYIIFSVDKALPNNLVPQDASGIALTPESEDILETLESQITRVLDRVGHGDKFNKRVQVQEEKARSNQCHIFLTSCRLGGVMVSVLAIRLKVCGFKPSQGDGFLRAIKMYSTPHVARLYGM